ncbi:hypothetical protein B7C51_20105 [Paenibacillus larvae subsp. pulvifaciens]|uniref:Uncharacterized protein n=1 Tax=Paenibacillus larvae subsp. pulvifaciens TaxID=1477 RepID=A0A1V0UWN9_9BACL|nr:hypothetical protein B7C51_20105 [Paenibacillus larvae subsp. pulvifaciens]
MNEPMKTPGPGVFYLNILDKKVKLSYFRRKLLKIMGEDLKLKLSYITINLFMKTQGQKGHTFFRSLGINSLKSVKKENKR